MEEMRNAYIVLIGKPERKKILGRLRRRWEKILELILGKLGGNVWMGIPGSE
jgi:hypothetical protein